MQIVERTIGTVMVLDMSGKLALGDRDGLLKDKVHSLVNQGRRQIALNLAGVSYMDSAGLGELVAAHGTVTKSGGQVKVFNLTKRVSDLLTITKVLTVFDTYDSEAEALASFSASAVTRSNGRVDRHTAPQEAGGGGDGVLSRWHDRRWIRLTWPVRPASSQPR